MSEMFKSVKDVFGHPPPRPTECPDCGSQSIVPICYGLPRAEMLELGRRGDIVLGGCSLKTPQWYCKHCFCRWPEDPPAEEYYGLPESRRKAIADAAAEYALLERDSAIPPSSDEPTVENCWQRADGRKVFLLRFPWGLVRIEKSLSFVPLGGAPEYHVIGGSSPFDPGFQETRHQAALASVRFERRASP